jgi:hypothetical protein
MQRPRARRAEVRGRADATALDVERYDLVGGLDWSERRLKARVTVTLGAERAPPARVVLDGRVATVRGVHLPSGEALGFAADADAGTLVAELGDRAAPGVAFVVDYEARAGAPGTTALTFVPERAGDPGRGRAAYTFSEPVNARAWLPSHDDPSDRAFFSIDLRVGPGERLAANGDLVADGAGGDCGGRMKYATSYPLPTYLMAFAVGTFDVERGTGPRGLPLSIWHRPGVPGDYRRTLAELDRLIGRFEGLTGVAYPFEKYALVLLPEFRGGEEHASASFQDETKSAQPDSGADLILAAHELAHQWFGDLVTVETWDDLWVKEGMATLLETEGVRPYYDRDGRGTFGADVFAVRRGQAARDPSRAPEEKYTTGPYGRAAWVLAQVRDRVGEAAFGGAWREVLTRHRFGAVGIDEVAEALRPSLGDDGVAQVRRALEAKALPALSFAPVEGGARVTLADPEGALVAPLRVAWHRAGGAVETSELVAGENHLVRAAADDLLVLDPPDAHPSWASLAATADDRSAYYASVASLTVPAGAGQRERFLGLGGRAQQAALLEGSLPALEPGEFEAFVRELDSDAAPATAVGLACDAAAAEGPGGPWSQTTEAALRARPHFVGLNEAPLYSTCASVAAPAELLPAQWRLLGTGLPRPWLMNEASRRAGRCEGGAVKIREPSSAPEALLHEGRR